MASQQLLSDPVSAARDALDRHAWQEAYDLLKQADREGTLGPEGLELLADAAWWCGRPGERIDVRQRAYSANVERGDKQRAAMLALNLSRDYLHKLDHAVSTGWHMRAERLLQDEPESAAHGFLALARAQGAIFGFRDLEGGLAAAKQALDLGSRFGNPDLQALALCLQGQATISLGQVQEGLALVDEAMVAAVGGELSPEVTGYVYCMTISACQHLADYRRAGEWTEAAKRWCERQSITGFPGVCRVHRAEIIRLRGAWAEAEAEARRATDELREFSMLDFVGEGFHEIGEIRLRMGDLAAAEEAFQEANALGRSPEPGLAQLRLAQGEADAALSLINRALAEDAWERLSRSRLLPAQVEIALAAGQIDTARRAADELEAIADEYESTSIRASAHDARSLLLLAEGEAGEALRDLRQSRKLWLEMDAPYEAARSRLWAGEAYRALGDEADAVLEFQAAKASFDRLGAVLDSNRAADLIEAGVAKPDSDAERVVKTFMFTDMVGSTALLEAIGEEGWQDVRRWHDQTLRSLFGSHRGEVVKHTGDGFFVAFGKVGDAVDCAVAVQRRLVEHRRAHGFAPNVRIGLHAAEATRVGEDYFGRAVHQAARIGGAAEAGEILASADALEDGSSFPLGARRTLQLKGLADPVEVRSVLWRESQA